MLNLLIALMGGSYERVAETAKLVTLKNRAELILQYEVRMSPEQLEENEQWHPTYLHALVPADDDVDEELDDDEAGVINGVKRALVADHASAEKQMVANHVAIEERVGGIQKKILAQSDKSDAKIEGLEIKIDAMQVQMEAILKKLDARDLCVDAK